MYIRLSPKHGTEGCTMTRIRTHPGEVLREEFMRPLGLSANALALDLRVPANRIGAIIRKENPRAVSADTAMRLARYFGTSAEFWLNLQAAYDLSVARREAGKTIERDVPSASGVSAHGWRITDQAQPRARTPATPWARSQASRGVWRSARTRPRASPAPVASPRQRSGSRDSRRRPPPRSGQW